jgi:hypothetical protein
MLKERIDSIIYQDNHEDVYHNILSEIGRLDLVIDEEDKGNGIIIVKWLTIIVNLIFCKFYSDKLLLEIKEFNNNTTKVDIFALPNLFRIKIKKGEKASDPKELIHHLKKFKVEKEIKKVLGT